LVPFLFTKCQVFLEFLRRSPSCPRPLLESPICSVVLLPTKSKMVTCFHNIFFDMGRIKVTGIAGAWRFAPCKEINLDYLAKPLNAPMMGKLTIRNIPSIADFLAVSSPELFAILRASADDETMSEEEEQDNTDPTADNPGDEQKPKNMPAEPEQMAAYKKASVSDLVKLANIFLTDAKLLSVLYCHPIRASLSQS